MSRSVAQRSLALAAVALLAAILALVLARDHRAASATVSTHPTAVGGGWYEALAAPLAPSAGGERTTCGRVLEAGSLGVAHPVLPCGTKLVFAYGTVETPAEVIDHRPVGAGRQFELTPALAARLGLTGTQRLRWRFAAGVE